MSISPNFLESKAVKIFLAVLSLTAMELRLRSALANEFVSILTELKGTFCLNSSAKEENLFSWSFS